MSVTTTVDSSATIDADGPPGRRVLLICYDYGPHNHTGGFRWRSMVEHLTGSGWEFDILAVDAGEPPPTGAASSAGPEMFPHQRAARQDAPGVVRHPVSPHWWLSRWRDARRARYLSQPAAAVSAPVDPESVPVQQPGTRPRIRDTVSALIEGVVDRACGWVWVRRALPIARQLARQHRHALVIATSPLHETHRIAAELARDTHAPYLADYRDPWYFGRGSELLRIDPVSRWLWRRWELDCLAAAQAITDIAPGAHEGAIDELREVAPELATRQRVVIPSGYDAAPVASVDRERFTVVYTGWLWPFMPFPALLQSLGRFRAELDPTDRHRLGVELVGVNREFNGVSIDAAAAGAGLGDCVRQRGRILRAQAARIQQSAAVMVAFDSVCATGICIPSKLYHYAQCHGSPLLIGHPTGSMAREAAQIGVRTYAPEDQAGIVDHLHDAWRRWQRGDMTTATDQRGVLDARHRAQEMDALMHSLVRQPGTMSGLQS